MFTFITVIFHTCPFSSSFLRKGRCWWLAGCTFSYSLSPSRRSWEPWECFIQPVKQFLNLHKMYRCNVNIYTRSVSHLSRPLKYRLRCCFVPEGVRKEGKRCVWLVQVHGGFLMLEHAVEEKCGQATWALWSNGFPKSAWTGSAMSERIAN